VEATVVTGRALGGLVNTNGASIELLVVHSVHGSISLAVAAETDETETTAAVGVTILDNDSFFNHAVLLETLTEGVISGVPCEAAIEPLLEKMRWSFDEK
jgi:hypothetical protein